MVGLGVRRMKAGITKFKVLILTVALFATGCSDEFGRNRAKVIFEYSSGFQFPADATNVFGIESSSDFHGDFSAALTFTVSPDELSVFKNLSKSAWAHPDDLKAISSTSNFIGGDSTLRSDKVFMIPAGTLMIEQKGPKDQIRKFAIDESTRRIYYYRSTW